MNPEKVIGCLYGQVIGDALGTRYEFKNMYQVDHDLKQDMVKNFLPILGGGPFKVEKGQVTDDTELAFGLLKSILENGRYDKEKAAQKYIKWYQSKPFDIGNNTLTILSGSKNYKDCIKKTNLKSLSNGCLMRCSPLGIYGIFINNEKLLQYAAEDCAITNPNPITVNAVQVYVIAVKLALMTNNKEYIFEQTLKYAKNSLIAKMLIHTKQGKKGFLLSDGMVFYNADSKFQGYFGVAFMMAFYELFHGNSFENSLINIIKYGGDTDTNSCIVGALLGAYYGVTKIPKQWINAVTIYNKRSVTYSEIDQKNIQNLAIQLVKLSHDNFQK